MIEREDVAALAKPLRESGDEELKKQIYDAVAAGPIETARVLPMVLFSDQTKGPQGVVRPFYYQESFVGDIIYQTYDDVFGLMPTGMGKTIGISMSMATRMFLQPENAVIVSYTEDQTKLIRNAIYALFENGHPIVRNALLDSGKEEVIIRRPGGRGLSQVFGKTAHVQNEGKTLLGIQGCTSILIDEQTLIPDDIFNTKIDRITPPQGHRRLMAGISTTQVANHLYDLTEGWNLPRFDKCDPYRPHVTQQGAAVYKATWRDGLKAGRYDKKYLDNRRAKLSPEEWNWWYECEWPTRGEEQAFGPDLIRQLVD